MAIESVMDMDGHTNRLGIIQTMDILISQPTTTDLDFGFWADKLCNSFG